MKFRFFSQTSLPILQTRFCQVFLEESSKIPRNQMYSKIRFSFLSNSSPYSIRKEHVSQKREKKKKKSKLRENSLFFLPSNLVPNLSPFYSFH